MMDPKYYCNDCNKTFTVRGFVARDSKKTGRSIICPHCGKNDTHPVGHVVHHRPSPEVVQDPSEAQLKYIIALGGRTSGVKTRKVAGEYINRLLKLKAATT
jgi:DNA-directed RNA polymerase subunit RPC12/RpoP